MSLLGAFSRRRSESDAPPWSEIVARLARSVLVLVKAEAGGLGGDLRRGVAVLNQVAVWGALTLCAGLLAGAALVTTAILGLAELLPVWAAALIVSGALLALFGGLVLKLKAVASDLESPVHTIQRRMADHGEWWRNELVTLARPDQSLAEDEGAVDE